MPPNSPYAERWGARIRLARLALNLNQEQVAAELGIRQSTLSRWERGTRVVPDPQRPRLAELLGVELAWLFNYDDTNGDDKQAA